MYKYLFFMIILIAYEDINVPVYADEIEESNLELVL